MPRKGRDGGPDIDGKPGIKEKLQRLFLIEATKYSVRPLDDRRFERFNPVLAGRPQPIRGNSQILFGGMGLERRLGRRHQEQVVLSDG
jgi:hypothetical protein